ncbi:MAG: hypothetical protein U0791_22935 [Gemmataceae bacterium]
MAGGQRHGPRGETNDPPAKDGIAENPAVRIDLAIELKEQGHPIGRIADNTGRTSKPRISPRANSARW